MKILILTEILVKSNKKNIEINKKNGNFGWNFEKG